MRHEEGRFPDAHDTSIYHQRWLPDSQPHAVLVIVHGLAEHCGRYTNVVDYFVPRGYAVCGADHVGHGRSGGRRVYVRRFEDLTDVLGTYTSIIRGWYPGKPLFLLGHSLGALIGSVYLLEHPRAFAGAILSGPLVSVPESVSQVTLRASRILSALAPGLGVAAVDASGVSRDPAVVAAYIGDPLVYLGKTTARLGHEILKAIARVTANAAQITLPILILQGSDDRLVPPEGAAMLRRAVGSADKILSVYDGLYHEIYNEPERDAVLADIEVWLRQRIAPGNQPPASTGSGGSSSRPAATPRPC